MEVYKFLPKVRGGAQRAEGSVVEGKLLYYWPKGDCPWRADAAA